MAAQVGTGMAHHRANIKYQISCLTPFVPTLPTEIRVRIISARRADRDEIRDYEETPR
ncbi:MAG: hypothetical protein M1449_12265 [Candidatus Thermoplasmatota archaeon]|nr:hypothetical protein [Candidatus Thermoplasmatota archaeon]